jgi:hypothetical protein
VKNCAQEISTAGEICAAAQKTTRVEIATAVASS